VRVERVSLFEESVLPSSFCWLPKSQTKSHFPKKTRCHYDMPLSCRTVSSPTVKLKDGFKVRSRYKAVSHFQRSPAYLFSHPPFSHHSLIPLLANTIPMSQFKATFAAAEYHSLSGLRGLLVERVISLQIDVKVRVLQCIPPARSNSACVSRSSKPASPTQPSA